MTRDDTQSAEASVQGHIESFAAPTSFGQQRLWFIDRYQPGLAVYNIPAAWRVRGALDRRALEQALNALVLRHEILRTRFDVQDGAPVQIVSAYTPVKIEVEALIDAAQDLAADSTPCISNSIDREAIDARVQAIALAEAEAPFDLSSGPLMRLRLVRIAEDDALLMLTMHHAISDMVSLGVVAEELRRFYSAYRQSRSVSLPALSTQYADFAAWQRDRLSGERRDALLRYWREYLDGAPDVLALPTDHPRPRIPSFRGDWVDIEFGQARSDALRDLSRRNGATLFMTLSALFQVLLFRSSGQSDFLVGYPASGRDHPEVEELIGLFVNTLVMRARLRPCMDFEALLRRLKNDVLDAHAHIELPLEMLIEALQPERDSSRHSLFQVAATWVDAEANAPWFPDIGLEPVRTPRQSSKFDLTLFATEGRDGSIGGGFEYSVDLFERATIERWAQRFLCLVDAVVATPACAISRLDALPAGERRLLLHEWNSAQLPMPTWRVHRLVARFARERPDAVALRCAGSDTTYAELDARAECIARDLRAQGIGRGAVVGVCIERSAALATSLLAVLKTGAAYVPLDPQLPSARLRFMAEDIGIATVVASGAAWSRSAQAFAGLRSPPIIIDGEDAALRHDAHGSGLDPDFVASDLATVSDEDSGDLAYCIYTSGSSGGPKAVAVSHGSLSAFIAWHLDRYADHAGGRMAQVASFGFDACTWEIWSCLTAGGTLVVIDDEVRGDTARLLSTFAAEGVEHAFLPTPLAELVIANPDNLPAGLALRSLSTGGDRLLHAPPQGLPFEVVNHYGPTEATVVTTAGVVRAEEVGPPTIGSPIASAQVYLLDGFGEPVPIGAPGELYVGGHAVSRGYWRRPALTAQSFVPDPFALSPGTRLFRTGDLARFRYDGRIEYLGRLDRQIKVRGFRIELGEIESALGLHPTIRRCAVEKLQIGEGRPRLIAFVETDLRAEEGAPLWRAHVERLLPQHMAPDAFVPIEQFPITSNHKLDRDALARMAQNLPVSEVAFVAPRNPLETKLAAILSELLGVERVGIHDNFFELGGQSLLAMQVVARVRSEIGIELKVRDLFEHPTIARLHACFAGSDTASVDGSDEGDGSDQNDRVVGEI